MGGRDASGFRRIGFRRWLPPLGMFGTVIVLSACGGGGASTASTRTTSVKASASTSTSTTTSSSSDSLPELVSLTQSGVIRIEATNCEGGDIGTGFLIGRRLVATVEHVIDGATSVSLVRNGRTLASGTVIGEDPARDVALVQTSKPLSGYIFHFSSSAPDLGDSVAAEGFPLGLPFTPTEGTVTGTDRTIPIDGIERRELIQTDAALNPGDSGGPLLSLSTGRVDGLVDAGVTDANGISFAVSARVAQPLISAWTVAPQPITAPTCQPATTPTTTTEETTTTATQTSSASSSAGQANTPPPVAAVDDYWDDISNDDFSGAWTYLAPGVSSESSFITGEKEVGLKSAEFEGSLASETGSTATVSVGYLQTIDNEYGCRTWTGVYDMVLQSGQWLIARANIAPQPCQ
jgi:S1-C subfamily serine protease